MTLFGSNSSFTKLDKNKNQQRRLAAARCYTPKPQMRQLTQRTKLHGSSCPCMYSPQVFMSQRQPKQPKHWFMKSTYLAIKYMKKSYYFNTKTRQFFIATEVYLQLTQTLDKHWPQRGACISHTTL